MIRKKHPAASERDATVPDRVRRLLSSRHLTLYRAAALIRERYPEDSRFHFPRNFYFQLLSSGLSPTLRQLLALSELTHYTLPDWLDAFGFRLDAIPQLQAGLVRPRTTILDNTIYDLGLRIPWFRDRLGQGHLPPVAPLSFLLESNSPRSLSWLLTRNSGKYLYAKIGQQDALAFPELMPGSLVRADAHFEERLPTRTGESLSKRIFLVEHRRGFSCCHLHFTAKNRVTLLSTQLPFATVELRLESEARILGVLDLEFRPFTTDRRTNRKPSRASDCYLPEMAPELTKLWTPAPFETGTPLQLPAFLKKARLRVGLSLREASNLSRTVANALRDDRYFVSPGSLSDYEADGAPPRHIHKLFTLAILYSIRFDDLIRSFGFPLDPGEMADSPITRDEPDAPRKQEPTPEERGTFLAKVFGQFKEIPFFLHDSLASLSGLPQVSLRETYWVGGQPHTLHPSLAGAQFIVVNRRNRRPCAFPRRPAWQQPLYLLRRRDGSYLMGSCAMENGTIVVHPFTDGYVPSERLRKTMDGEVIGQITLVVRSFA